MSSTPSVTALFDLAGTLAFVQTTADGKHIASLDVYRGIPEVLRELTESGVDNIGIVYACAAVRDTEVRDALRAGLPDLPSPLVVAPKRRALRRIFARAAAAARERAASAGAVLLFVGTEAADREMARGAGFLTAPHPRLAPSLLRGGGPLRYLRIRVPPRQAGSDWAYALRNEPLVPFHVTLEPGAAAPTFYAVADTATAAGLDDLGFWVDRLGPPDAPQTTTAYLIRDDLQQKHRFLEPVGNASSLFADGHVGSGVLASTHEGLLVALSTEQPVAGLRFVDAFDGRTRRRSPSLTLFQSGGTVAPRSTALDRAAAADPLSDCERCVLDRHFTPAFMEATVTRYAGTPQTGFTSRHVEHAGNQLAVDALVSELDGITPGRLTVERHCFKYNQGELTNVVATLPASGMQGEGVVVISAHLDSTAEFEPDFDPPTWPAPGADDDGSGMAAVLAAARAMLELASLGRPHREIRFGFFNCEEIDKSGSETYANAQAALHTQLAAVFHIDMIGYDQKPPARFEVHAGYGAIGPADAKAAKARSREQAELIEHLRPILTALPRTEISTSPEELGADRSDHCMFHGAGYPAVWITEDFFPESGVLSDVNPAYHTTGDTLINPDYASQIARLVGAAAWIAATR